jgi:hypothetical protein
MKFLIPFALLSLVTVQAQQPAISAPTSDAPTHQQLLERQAQAKESASKAASQPTQVQLSVDPAKANKPQSLLARSEILCFGGGATLVPKKAVIHKPASLASRTATLSPGAKLQPWREFYAANRGWISTMEVTRAQAEGKEPFSEEMAKSIAQSSAIIVATFSGDPITVYPAPPKEAAASSTPNPPHKK